MRKIFTIAIREYRAMVGTKAFLITIIMMPVLMLGSLVAIEVLRNAVQTKERKIALIDHSGRFTEGIKLEADKNNALLDALEKAVENSPSGDAAIYNDFLEFSRNKYLIEVISHDRVSDDTRVELSNRIRDQDLYAFVEIPAGAGDPDADDDQKIRFYAQDASLSEARVWIERIVNDMVRTTRLKEADIDPLVVERARAQVNIAGMGLVERAADGSIVSLEEQDPMSAIFLPMGVMVLMFMVIFMAAQPMLECVLEEKSQRIAEVLLGSGTHFN